ncbi:Uncharacterised protein [Legionella cincinnatiensis]|uniref:Uncharacterized protein n=1 Tax=Legionella cincinnatiensis TaxID=28085 RepID=A0A378IKR1_9GAMM|nr:hypothetical protein Lcin_2473 [Legionella cincinnatiensis]STX35857.1 Uncharacterised protein [Legionella cincinnatiensis]
MEDDVFDMIEFLYDCISIPSDGFYHSYNNCGYHEYKNFDKITTRQEYQLRINELLKQYSDGYELSKNGCILILVEGEFNPLLKAAVPACVRAHDEAIRSRPNNSKCCRCNDGQSHSFQKWASFCCFLGISS